MDVKIIDSCANASRGNDPEAPNCATREALHETELNRGVFVDTKRALPKEIYRLSKIFLHDDINYDSGNNGSDDGVDANTSQANDARSNIVTTNIDTTSGIASEQSFAISSEKEKTTNTNRVANIDIIDVDVISPTRESTSTSTINNDGEVMTKKDLREHDRKRIRLDTRDAALIPITNSYSAVKEWWKTIVPESDVIAFDCECVMYRNTKPPLRRKYRHLCALLGIVDYDENVVLDARVKHRGFHVNEYTVAINGIKSNDLKVGISLITAGKLLDELCRLPISRALTVRHWSRLVVSWGEQDISYLPIKPDVRNLDIQAWFVQCDVCCVVPDTPVTKCDHHRQRLSLSAVYAHFFKKSIQRKIHTPKEDAAATMRIFRYVFLPEILKNNGVFRLKYVIKRKPPWTYCSSITSTITSTPTLSVSSR